MAILAYLAGIIGFSIISAKLLSILTGPGFQTKGKHVFITGGSAGLGLSMAIKCALSEAKVTIVSRSKLNLEAAKKKIIEACQSAGKDVPSVFICPCDVSVFSQVQEAIQKSNEFHGQATDFIICSAGLAIPEYFIKQDISDIEKQMNINYFGSLYTVKAALPEMVKQNVHGKIIFVSSACGYIGFIGYSSYAPSKYALRGLADSLRNELLLYNISVSIFYPGNMDTPGYANEEKSKPAETKEIEGASPLVTSDQAADDLIAGVSRGEYAITNDLGGYLLRVIGNGIPPRTNSVFEMLWLPIGVLIQVVFRFHMDYIVKSSKNQSKPKTE